MDESKFAKTYDLVEAIREQKRWSEETFGPGDRTTGILDHICKELLEIKHAPSDTEALEEWIDVIILALDGAWRLGASPELICATLQMKYAKNRGRRWPDWREAEPGKAIEHIREE